MQAQITNITALDQNNPKHNILKSKRGTVMPFIVDGCAVSFSSSPKNTEDTITTVKEILLSAYKTKTVKG